MSGAWTEQELRRVGEATELQIASRRDDGSLRPYVTIWTVRAGDLTTALPAKEYRWNTRRLEARA